MEDLTRTEFIRIDETLIYEVAKAIYTSETTNRAKALGDSIDNIVPFDERPIEVQEIYAEQAAYAVNITIGYLSTKLLKLLVAEL